VENGYGAKQRSFAFNFGQVTYFFPALLFPASIPEPREQT